MRPPYAWPERSIRNIVKLQCDRSYNDIETLIKNRLTAACHIVDRLDIESRLVGHKGCVNCLDWGSNGRLLVSGSDDTHIIVWDVFKQNAKVTLMTMHQGNIFSVKFMPDSGDRVVASGAADGRICIYHIRENEVQDSPYWKCKCHTQRVKRLATVAEHPSMLWSGAEDGRILQFDLREPHNCSPNEKIQLIDLHNHMGPGTEVKCIAINQRRPEQLAVGATDNYARIFDLRMIRLNPIGSPTSSFVRPEPEDNLTKYCATYYCPGNLNTEGEQKRGFTGKNITYLAFSPDGTELLVNMGSEQLYLYNLLNAEPPAYPNFVRNTFVNMESTSNASTSTQFGFDASKRIVRSEDITLQDIIDDMKTSGNRFLHTGHYLDAVYEYSDGITACPDCPEFYASRAIAFMKRNWVGDTYAGLRDCQQALRLDPTYMEAHLRMTRALCELEYLQEANECLTEFNKRHPENTLSDVNKDHIKLLTKKIEKLAERQKELLEQIEKQKLPAHELIPSISEYEQYWRANAKDYSERFVGHCNTTTDIKEANFFGNDGTLVIAGSDDGCFYIWDRPSNKIFAVFKGDSNIVNCVQPHPKYCMLATSGIDREVLIWSPGEEDTHSADRVEYVAKMAVNQQRMQADPFEFNSTNSVCRTS